MKSQELKDYINRTLGNNVRCLLPSYWWKRLFELVVDKVDELDTQVAKLPSKSYVDTTVSNAVSNVSIAVDSYMDSTSTNPVQNKVVKEYVDSNIGGITFTVGYDTVGEVYLDANEIEANQAAYAKLNSVGLTGNTKVNLIIYNIVKSTSTGGKPIKVYSGPVCPDAFNIDSLGGNYGLVFYNVNLGSRLTSELAYSNIDIIFTEDGNADIKFHNSALEYATLYSGIGYDVKGRNQEVYNRLQSTMFKFNALPILINVGNTFGGISVYTTICHRISEDGKYKIKLITQGSAENSVYELKEDGTLEFVESVSTETDPIFSASVAANITDEDISNWNNKVDSQYVDTVISQSITNTLNTAV